jgi:hypothetical protein
MADCRPLRVIAMQTGQRLLPTQIPFMKNRALIEQIRPYLSRCETVNVVNTFGSNTIKARDLSTGMLRELQRPVDILHYMSNTPTESPFPNIR